MSEFRKLNKVQVRGPSVVGSNMDMRSLTIVRI